MAHVDLLIDEPPFRRERPVTVDEFTMGRTIGNPDRVVYSCGRSEAPLMEYELKTADGMQWIDEGAGPVLLPMAGLFGIIPDWTPLVRHFRTVCRVIVPILPVHGLPPHDANVTELTRFVRRFVEYHGLTDMNLVGNSLGGQIALMYTRIHGERVRTLTLTGSSGLRENSMARHVLHRRSPRRDDYQLVRSIALMTIYDPSLATTERIDAVYEVMNNDAKLTNVIAIIKSSMRLKMTAELPLINHPTCLIWGVNDALTPTDVAEEFHSLLPNSELFWIDKCGHTPMVEHPREFNELLQRWYEKQGVLNRTAPQQVETRK